MLLSFLFLLLIFLAILFFPICFPFPFSRSSPIRCFAIPFSSFWIQQDSLPFFVHIFCHSIFSPICFTFPFTSFGILTLPFLLLIFLSFYFPILRLYMTPAWCNGDAVDDIYILAAFRSLRHFFGILNLFSFHGSLISVFWPFLIFCLNMRDALSPGDAVTDLPFHLCCIFSAPFWSLHSTCFFSSIFFLRLSPLLILCVNISIACFYGDVADNLSFQLFSLFLSLYGIHNHLSFS